MAEIFLKIDNVPGESIDAADGDSPHIGDIELQDWRLGISNDAPQHMTETDKDKVTQHTNVTDLVVTKWIDLATKPLLQFCAEGTIIEKATLTLRKLAGDHKHEYFVVDFTKLKVVSVDWPQGEDKKEDVTFRFATFKLKYTMQDNAGEGSQGSLEFGWNQEEHEELHEP